MVMSLENKSGYQGRQLSIYVSRLCLRMTIVPAISNGRLKRSQSFSLSRLYVPSVNPDAHLRQVGCIDADLNFRITSLTLAKLRYSCIMTRNKCSVQELRNSRSLLHPTNGYRYDASVYYGRILRLCTRPNHAICLWWVVSALPALEAFYRVNCIIGTFDCLAEPLMRMEGKAG